MDTPYDNLLLKSSSVGVVRIYNVLEVVVLLICVMSGRDITSVTVSVHEVVTWNNRKQYATKVLALGKLLKAMTVSAGRVHRSGTILSTDIWECDGLPCFCNGSQTGHGGCGTKCFVLLSKSTSILEKICG